MLKVALGTAGLWNTICSNCVPQTCGCKGNFQDVTLVQFLYKEIDQFDYDNFIIN